MLYKKYGKKLRGTAKRSVRKTKRSPKVSTTVKKYVTQALHKNMENKLKVNYGTNQTIENSAASTCTYPLIIATSQGTSEADRIGNNIKVVKGQYKVAINLLPYDATTNQYPNPCWVNIWIVKDLRVQTQATTMDATSYANFFSIGSTTVGFQGNTFDTIAPVNKEGFRVLKKYKFRLGVTSAFSAGMPSYNQSYFDNSQMSKILTINWGKYVKKTLKYNDSVSSQCQNDNLYIVYQINPCDGSAAANQKICEIHYFNTMEFEDA